VLGLATLPALGRGLDAVEYRVLHEVQERVGNLLDDGVVELDALARQLEIHRLAHHPRQLPHLAGITREERADPDHA
jgi:hypothetical protein